MNKPTGPDVRLLREEKLPKLEFPGGKEQEFRIFFAPEVHEQIWKHGRDDMTVEICGVVVGTWGCDVQGPFVTITASIRGEAAGSRVAEVTFTHETWSKINAEMDSKYADRSIVGWYHTHPNFGIFLSDRDRFIQENFFSGPGQIAFVVDPIRKQEGVFVWREGKTAPAPHYWVGNRVLTPGEAEEGRGGSRAAASGSTAAAEGAVTSVPPLPEQGRPTSIALLALQFVLVFLLGYLVHGNLNAWAMDRMRLESNAFALLQLGLRPGLEGRVAELRANLGAVSRAAESLAESHVQLLDKSAGDNKKSAVAAKEVWKEVQALLARTQGTVETMEREFCPTLEERALRERLLQANLTAHRKRSDETGGKQATGSDKTSAKDKSPASAGSSPTETKPARSAGESGAAAKSETKANASQ